MESHHLAALLAPLGAALLAIVALGIKWLVANHLPPGRIKDAILKERFRSGLSESSRRVRERAQYVDARARGGR